MKFLVSYKHNMKIQEDMELDIYYNYQHNIDKLMKFVELAYPNRITIIMYPKDCNEFFANDLFLILNDFYSNSKKANFTVEFPFPLEDENLHKCRFPYFFSNPVNNYIDLQSYINLGVSDVIIDKDLLYDLNNVKTIASKHNVKIRAYIDSITVFNSYKDFFILPGDVSHAAKYIDILIMPSHSHYDIYRKGMFKGDVGRICSCPIHKYTNEDPVFKQLFYLKSNCKLKCLKGANCNYCKNCEEKYEIAFQNKHMQ